VDLCLQSANWPFGSARRASACFVRSNWCPASSFMSTSRR